LCCVLRKSGYSITVRRQNRTVAHVDACEPSRPQAKQVAQRASGMAAIDNNAAVLFRRLR